MLESLSNDAAAELLLENAPAGQYLLELLDGWLLLWRLSEGEPDGDALESAICWPWSMAEVA